MLFPSKHSEPDQTVLAGSTVLLRELRRKRVVGFDELRDSLTSTAGTSTDFVFLPAIGLLHLLGLVEYRSTVDAFEYRGS